MAFEAFLNAEKFIGHTNGITVYHLLSWSFIAGFGHSFQKTKSLFYTLLCLLTAVFYSLHYDMSGTVCFRGDS